MKKYIFFLIAGTMLLAACNKDFGDINVDKKKPASVTPGALFSFGSKEMIDIMNSSNVNRNIFRLLSQQWTETTYIDESNYDLITRNIPQNFWNVMYVNVLNNIKECQRLIPDQNPAFFPAAVQTNQNSICELCNVYAYSTLVNTYGNIPYSEALDIAKVHPKYDDGAAIYADLLTRLDNAMSKIDVGQGGFGSNDIIFGDDMAAWKRFGNSLKLRLGMMLADVDAAKAKSVVEAAAAGAVLRSDDNLYMSYLSTKPNTNPLWVDLVESGRKDFVAANTLVDAMTAVNDPRIPGYFTNDAAGGFSGGENGSSNNYATFSKPNTRLIAPDFEGTIFDAAECNFLLAEAAERGFNVGGTAESFYNAAITASMEYWGVSAADIATYLAQPSVAYTTAAGDWKQKIGTQTWIALYNRGHEAWTSYRRLDFPVLVAPVDALTVLPLRYTYPTQEQTLNNGAWKAGSAAIGGDGVDTKLFWDKF